MTGGLVSGVVSIPKKRLISGVIEWLLGSYAFTPLALFRNSEQGAWFDPSDFSSMFQDSAGTTPVTAVEQPVGLILDKSGNGNHAIQATAAARPVVSARVNLLRYTEDLSNGVWEDVSSGVTAKTYGQTDPLGGTTAVKLVGNHANTWFTQNIGAVQAADYTLSMWIRADAPVTLDMLFSYGVTDLVSVNVTTAWQRFSVTAARAATVGLFAGLNVGNGNNIYVWHPQLESGTTATRYQRVTTASDYDTVGFPHYLVFDGVDDSLATAAVDLTSTYQVSAFAGASANYVGNYAPLYANGWAYESGEPNAGLFSAYIPKQGSGTVRFDLGGVTTASNVTVSVDITAAHVYMQSMDSTASPYQVIRVDGAQVATGTVNVGGQPFAGTAVKIADRDHGAGASFFSGKLYQLIIRGAASTEAEINATEAYIASKSGATL